MTHIDDSGRRERLLQFLRDKLDKQAEKTAELAEILSLGHTSDLPAMNLFSAVGMVGLPKDPSHSPLRADPPAVEEERGARIDGVIVGSGLATSYGCAADVLLQTESDQSFRLAAARLQISDALLEVPEPCYVLLGQLGVTAEDTVMAEPAPATALVEATDGHGPWIHLSRLEGGLSPANIQRQLAQIYPAAPYSVFVEKFGEHMANEIAAWWDMNRNAERPLTLVRLVLSDDNSKCEVHMRSPASDQHHVMNRIYTDESAPFTKDIDPSLFAV